MSSLLLVLSVQSRCGNEFLLSGSERFDLNFHSSLSLLKLYPLDFTQETAT